MQFTDEEWLALSSKLERATSASKLIWSSKEETAGSIAFHATVPGSAIYTLRSRDSDNLFPFILEVSNTDGTTLSEFTTVPYGDEWELSDNQRTSAIIDGLYSHVERLVTGAPQKAQSLLDGLDSLLPDNEAPF